MEKSTEEKKDLILEQLNSNAQQIAEYLKQISQSLMKMTILLGEGGKEGNAIHSQAVSLSSESESNDDLEIEFLNEIIQVYQKEAERKALQQKKRKSSKYIQAEIQSITCNFFARHIGAEFIVNKYQDAYILISTKNGKNIALIRVVNDLGFMRNKLTESAIKPLIETGDELEIPSTHTFLIVLTLVNSLIQADVREVLGRPDLTNRDLYKLKNHEAPKLIHDYLTNENGLLDKNLNELFGDNDASKHVLFILRSSNPNAEGDAMFSDPRYQLNWTNEHFYDKPFKDLFATIQQM